MLKTMTKTMMGLGFGALAWMAVPSDANAYSNDYCREYTRTVSIGGRLEEAYGQACLQSDGSWMIVSEDAGNNVPANATNVNYVIRDNTRIIRSPRVVYYQQPHVVRRTYPTFVWYHNDRYNGSHYAYKQPKYKKDNGWHKGKGHDRGRDDHRGRGRH